MSLTGETAATADNNPISDVEAQMRRALGLYGGMRQRVDNDRSEQPARTMDRFGSLGGNHGGTMGGNQGLHRRRFVQDGEIPVTVVRRDATADSNAPQSSRLQRTEAALAAETAARDRAERALHDAQAQISALQTKIGHAELSRVEAVDIARREREAATQLREFSEGFEEQLQAMQDRVESAELSKRYAQGALHDERIARKAVERALRDLTDRADQAEAGLQSIEQDAESDDDHAPVALRPLPTPADRYTDVKVPARRGRPPGSKSVLKTVVQAANEAEPVQWWLMPLGKAKAR
jgi:hypothetical protein